MNINNSIVQNKIDKKMKSEPVSHTKFYLRFNKSLEIIEFMLQHRAHILLGVKD